MTKETENPYDDLKKIFHEPKRMAIMSALCAADSGLTFTELKLQCDISDGNLNRHLKVLKEAKAVNVKKKFVDAKPQTTIFLSEKGIAQFSGYLGALSHVLNQALEAMPMEKKSESVSPLIGEAVVR